MKKCPQCNTEYFDNALEFCLDDGRQLFEVGHAANEAATVTTRSPTTEKTEYLPFLPQTEISQSQAQAAKKETLKTAKNSINAVSASVKSTGTTTAEIAPLVISLVHNWWQWLYLSNQRFDSVTNFLLSPAFLIWLVLLTAGIITGVIVLKYFSKKGFAYAGLVILAVNLILFLVPRR